jgi:diaminohydroxyphosphoribosylaminopyrimidine deaminase / 5-amino-6-(5-phosphoribosylamino)uracil reductase
LKKDTSNITFTSEDAHFMRIALDLAAKGKGYVSPNPLVGCVIVSQQGTVIGSGWHEHFGGPHAEINALGSVKNRDDLVNATLYVTLEPCSHQGKTPPCADALSSLPIKRIVVAMTDPNPKVNGEGIQRLKVAGKQVDVGLLEDDARRLNEAFIYNIRFGKPWVFLKIAQSIDGYITAPDGEPSIFTDKESQRLVHSWRSQYDGVMVGGSTALHDNPRLTVRLVEGRQPKRIVIDGPGELPDVLHLFSDQFENKTIRVTHQKPKPGQGLDPMLQLLSTGSYRGQTMHVRMKDNHCDLKEVIRRLPEFGVHSVLVEGGQSLSSALLREGLVDKMAVFIAPFLLGGGTRSVIGLGVERLDERLALRNVDWQQVGKDMLMTGYF